MIIRNKIKFFQEEALEPRKVAKKRRRKQLDEKFIQMISEATVLMTSLFKIKRMLKAIVFILTIEMIIH